MAESKVKLKAKAWKAKSEAAPPGSEAIAAASALSKKVDFKSTSAKPDFAPRDTKPISEALPAPGHWRLLDFTVPALKKKGDSAADAAPQKSIRIVQWYSFA
jgi:hypothetical protein